MSEEKVMVNVEELEDIVSVVYLGAKVSKAGGADCGIISELGKARTVFAELMGVWNSSIPSKSTKIRIFKSCCCMVVNHGRG